MIHSFKNQGTSDIFNGKATRKAMKTCPQSLWNVAVRKLDLLDSVTSLDELRIPPGNRLEALKGERQGLFAVSASMNNIVSALFGLKWVLLKWISLIITDI